MPDLHDILALLGLLLIGAGVWWVYPPAALILVGAILLGVAVTRRPPAGGEG